MTNAPNELILANFGDDKGIQVQGQEPGDTFAPTAYVLGFQPIATANPKDQDEALLMNGGEAVVGRYMAQLSAWFDAELVMLESVTHWMPIPKA